MMELILSVHKAVAEAAPVIGVVSDGTEVVSNWRIDFVESATKEQRDAAQQLLASFDVAKFKARLDVPKEVWAGAMMRALGALGIGAQVEAIVAASSNWLLQKLWARAAAFKRDDPMITAVGQAAGWSEKDLDDLFRLAGSFDK